MCNMAWCMDMSLKACKVSYAESEQDGSHLEYLETPVLRDSGLRYLRTTAREARESGESEREAENIA